MSTVWSGTTATRSFDGLIQKLRAAPLAPMVLFVGFAAFATFYLQRVWGDFLYDSGELTYHCRAVLSAKRALLEGQFSFNNDSALKLQPMLLYYSPAYLFTAALFQIVLGLSSYKSLLLTVGLFVGVGMLGIYGSLRELRAAPLYSALGAIVFAFAPYLITDIFVRSAFAEVTAFCTFPVLLWSFLRLCRRLDFSSLLYCIAANALFILAHKIFIVWSVGLLTVTGALLYGRSSVRPLIFYYGAVAAAMCLTAYYWLNSYLSVPNLQITHYSLQPYLSSVGAHHNVQYDGRPSALGIAWAFINSDASVFYPYPYTHPISSTRMLNLQLGPIISVALAAACFFIRRSAIRTVLLSTALSTLLACSLFHFVPFWRFVPSPMLVIQFPYRLLLFASAFGSILAALVLEAFQQSSGKARLIGSLICAVAVTTQIATFVKRVPMGGTTCAQSDASPFINRDYSEVGGVVPGAEAPVADAEVAISNCQGNRIDLVIDARRPGVVSLPAFYSHLLNIDCPEHSFIAMNSEKQLAVDVPQRGSYHLSITRRERLPWFVGLIVGTGVLAIMFWIVKRYTPRAAPLLA